MRRIIEGTIAGILGVLLILSILSILYTPNYN